MSQIDDQLRNLQQQSLRKQELEKKIHLLFDERQQLAEKVRQLDSIKQAEQADVEKLQGRSLSRLYYSVIGKMDERIDKEQQEAYTAAVKHETACRELAEVEEDIARKQTELASIRGCDRQYSDLLAEKTNAVKRSGSAESQELMKLEKELGYITNQIREVSEATAAGRSARESADSILTSLGSAESWGTWDLFGGGMISDFAKHNHLDEAQSKVEYLQMQLRRFKTELADIQISADMNIQIDGFLKFADFFFDGLFADWAVLDRIGNSKQQVTQTKQQIEQVLNRLDQMKRTFAGEQDRIKQRISEIVLRAQVGI
ncbi:MAG: hypothetical protein PHQ55_09130 [Eubacteriales bacterium]|nr:hypothetical protein [Eubacteriales bacterium]